jgi:methylmalonyl-CoA epimerase
VATSGEGLVELLEAIARHGRANPPARAARRRARDLAHLRDLVIGRLMARLPESLLERAADETGARTTDPHRAADRLAAALTSSAPAWLDHVGVATTSLSESVRFLRDQLGGVSGEVEDVAAQHVRVQFVRGVGGSGQTAIELIEPFSDDSTLARFLATRGPGLHHIAIRVDDLDVVLERLSARGVRLVDQQPKAGAHGRRVAFIHPHAAHGVLIELVETGGHPRARR